MIIDWAIVAGISLVAGAILDYKHNEGYFLLSLIFSFFVGLGCLIA